jgi:hypothetical protein
MGSTNNILIELESPLTSGFQPARFLSYFEVRPSLFSCRPEKDLSALSNISESVSGRVDLEATITLSDGG